MRFAVAALCVLALTGPTFAAADCLRVKQPPLSAMREPTIPYSVHSVPRAAVNRYCPRLNYVVTACSFPVEGASDGRWAIFISDDLDLTHYACVIRYEKSHLPPNLWGDPAIEYPEMMEMLKDMRAKG